MKRSNKKARNISKIHILSATIIAALILTAGVTALRRARHTESIDDIFSSIEKQTKEKYSYIHVDKTSWPAQMGSGVGLNSPDRQHSYTISSQSMPSIYFLMPVNTPPTAIYSVTNVAESIDKVTKDTGYRINDSESDARKTYKKGSDHCLYSYDNQQAVVTFSCYDDNLVKRAFALSDPIVKAYLANNTNVAENSITFGPLVIKSQNGHGVITASQTAEYDIAEAVLTINGEKKIALFYKADESNWQFVTQATDEYGFTCEAFMQNVDARNAFYGQICLSNEGHVRLDSSAKATQ